MLEVILKASLNSIALTSQFQHLTFSTKHFIVSHFSLLRIMSQERETNPHFLELEPLQPQRPDRHSDHGPWLQIPHKRDRDRRPGSRGQRYGQLHKTPLPQRGNHHDRHPTTLLSHPGPQGQLSRAPSPVLSPPGSQYKESSPPSPKLSEPHTSSRPAATTFMPLRYQGQQPSPTYGQRSHPPHGPRLPSPKETKPHTWLIAVFCAVFWLIIILGGLAVLIVYLVFRPSDPRFDISTASLNAAYLDMGYLLNADVTILANFTNPNKKVSVDFSHLIVGLYYGNTLIGTTYIEPFKATSRQSRFANIHMVTSQVRLPMKEIQHLKNQVQRNRIIFEVRGWFRARSHLGDYLPYSYTLYGHCTIAFTGPPDGALVAGHCRTKR